MATTFCEVCDGYGYLPQDFYPDSESDQCTVCGGEGVYDLDLAIPVDIEKMYAGKRSVCRLWLTGHST